jgi:transposase-like protein
MGARWRGRLLGAARSVAETSETGAAWNQFFADLIARSLHGVRLVTSEAHRGLWKRSRRTFPSRAVSDAERFTLRT